MDKFENIQVGDQVIVHQRWSGDSIETVTKVTKTTFTAGSRTFRKDSGWERGGDKWTPSHADIATEESMAKVMEGQMKAKYVRYFSSFNYGELPLDKLQEIYQIIKK